MKTKHVLLVIAIMAAWGLAPVANKIGVTQIPPIFLTALRSCVVALVLLPFLKSPRGHIPQLLLLSLLMGTLHYCFVFTGIKGIDASLTTLLVMMQVPFTSLLAVPFFGERLGWRRILGLVTAFAGIALITVEPKVRAEFLPAMLILIGIFFWSASNILIKRMRLTNGNVINGWVAILSAPQLFAISFLLETDQVAAMQAADWTVWSALLYMAIVITAITFALWYRLLRQYTVNQVVPYTLLMPIFGVAASMLVLGDTLSWIIFAGGLMTLAGVAIIVLRRPSNIETGV